MDLPQYECADKSHSRYGGRRLEKGAEGEAQRIALRLRTLAEGPIDRPETWTALFDFFDIDPIPFPGPQQATGEYIRHDEEPVSIAITWNENLPAEGQSRVIIHEIAHHLLYEAAPFFIFDSPLVYFYDDETGSVAHRIACRVERLVMG